MENDLKSDALNIGSKGQHDLRKTIIRMLKDGKKGKEIAKDLGVSEGHVSNVKKLYEAGGAAALKPKKRGRPAGKNKILTPEQEKEIQGILSKHKVPYTVHYENDDKHIQINLVIPDYFEDNN